MNKAEYLESRKHRLNLGEEHYKQFLEIFDGIVLGDGYIDKNGCLIIGQSIRDVDNVRDRKQWLEQINQRLANFGVQSVITEQVTKECFIAGKRVEAGIRAVLRTLTYEEFKAQRTRWYVNGKKRVPKDITLAPVTVAYWFAGDGCGHENGGLEFCTEDFSYSCIQLLMGLLDPIVGVRVKRHKTSNPNSGDNIGVWKRNAACALRDFMIEELHSIWYYKLRYVRPLVQTRLIDEVVLEIRARFAKGETQQELAKEFKLNRHSVNDLINGRTHKALGGILSKDDIIKLNNENRSKALQAAVVARVARTVKRNVKI